MTYYGAMVGNVFDMRLRMVQMAQDRGVSEAAKVFVTTRKTVRKWMGRYQEQGLDGLVNRSRAPNRCPHKISDELEQQIVVLRRRLPSRGQDRLVEDFALPCSPKTVHRVLRAHGLIAKRRKRWQKRQDLRERKKQMRPFEKVQVDVKDLSDIDRYWPQMKRLSLPRYEFTARDMKTGGCFFAYGHEKSLINSVLFAGYVGQHLKKYGVNLSEVVFQTDNGSEFVGSTNMKAEKSAFTELIEDVFKAKHERIPPRCCTWNSDVEAFHGMVEDDFYEVEDYRNGQEFLAKAYSYQLYFNYKRKNRWRDRMSPIDILRSEKHSPVKKRVLNLPPIIMDHLIPKLEKGGYLVPAAACCLKIKCNRR
jgi:transposase